MEETIQQIFSGDNIIFIVGGTIAVIAIVVSSVRRVAMSGSRERSRREIAAYIAEGSMTPEQGERLMKAGNDDKRCS